MKSKQPSIPAVPHPIPARLSRFSGAVASGVLMFGLSGCNLFPHVRSVNKIVVVDNVLDSTLAQLLAELSTDYNDIQTITATVDIAATTGGGHKGEVKEYPSFAGYIVVRKPQDLHLLMLTPAIRSRALEMVSDGKDFKLYIPPQNKAVVGRDEITTSSKNGLENLRPYIIRDALLVPPLADGERVALINGARITPPGPGHKNSSLEEPDYDLTVLRPGQGQQDEIVRVIHIGRVTLRPYEQDIYDPQGHIVTVVTYDNYKKYGDRIFPTSILITRPIDEFSLKIDFTKVTFNLKVDDDSFLLKIPDTVPVQKM